MCRYALGFKTSFHKYWQAELSMQKHSLPPAISWVSVTWATAARQRGSLYSGAADPYSLQKRVTEILKDSLNTDMITFLIYAPSYVKNNVTTYTATEREEKGLWSLRRMWTGKGFSSCPLSFAAQFLLCIVTEWQDWTGYFKRDSYKHKHFQKNICHKKLITPLIHEVWPLPLYYSSPFPSLLLYSAFF